jgi:hypothetical protein
MALCRRRLRRRRHRCGRRGAGPKVMDWVCGRCSTVNFARRNQVPPPCSVPTDPRVTVACLTDSGRRGRQCFSCSSPRTGDAVLVSATLGPGGGGRGWESGGGGASSDEPCNMLIVRGLAPETTEETVRSTFAHFGSVGAVDTPPPSPFSPLSPFASCRASEGKGRAQGKTRARLRAVERLGEGLSC